MSNRHAISSSFHGFSAKGDGTMYRTASYTILSSVPRISPSVCRYRARKRVFSSFRFLVGLLMLRHHHTNSAARVLHVYRMPISTFHKLERALRIQSSQSVMSWFILTSSLSQGAVAVQKKATAGYRRYLVEQWYLHVRCSVSHFAIIAFDDLDNSLQESVGLVVSG